MTELEQNQRIVSGLWTQLAQSARNNFSESSRSTFSEAVFDPHQADTFLSMRGRLFATLTIGFRHDINGSVMCGPLAEWMESRFLRLRSYATRMNRNERDAERHIVHGTYMSVVPIGERSEDVLASGPTPLIALLRFVLKLLALEEEQKG